MSSQAFSIAAPLAVLSNTHMPFSPGDPVHVAALGKAIVREVRNRGRYLVELKGRTMIVAEGQLTAVEERRHRRQAGTTGAIPRAMPDAVARANAPASIDLHGMTADEAITAVDAFLNDAILASLDEIRIIHGRSGRRLKGVVHARLRELRPVRAFRVDPGNPGVTIVTL